MDFHLLKTFGLTMIIFMLSGVIILVPLTRYLSHRKGQKTTITYKYGLLWGGLTGLLFILLNYLMGLIRVVS